jgi:hypothetical protein
MEDLAAMFMRLDAEENGVAPQPVAPAPEIIRPKGHARQQVMDRYGIDVRPETLARKIEAGLATFVCNGAGAGRLIYFVPIQAFREIVWIKVVYAPSIPGVPGWIVTVLPPLWKSEMLRMGVDERHEENSQRSRVTKKRFFLGLKQSEDADDDFVNEQVEEEAEA